MFTRNLDRARRAFKTNSAEKSRSRVKVSGCVRFGSAIEMLPVG